MRYGVFSVFSNAPIADDVSRSRPRVHCNLQVAMKPEGVSVATARRGLLEAQCPIARAVDVLGDRWTLLILKNANVGITRFDQFRNELGIADNILSSRLTRLVELGLMVRQPYELLGRTRYEYQLSASGADVLPILHTFAEWGQKHTTLDGGEAEPVKFIHTVCGEPMEHGEYCTTCDVRVPREEEAWVRPWREQVVTAVSESLDSAADPVPF
jgi:DNA-binding HxlR family transcriptional regulator